MITFRLIFRCKCYTNQQWYDQQIKVVHFVHKVCKKSENKRNTIKKEQNKIFIPSNTT